MNFMLPSSPLWKFVHKSLEVMITTTQSVFVWLLLEKKWIVWENFFCLYFCIINDKKFIFPYWKKNEKPKSYRVIFILTAAMNFCHWHPLMHRKSGLIEKYEFLSCNYDIVVAIKGTRLVITVFLTGLVRNMF